ncbi:MAG: competence/damage-inducible protein A [Tannerella sp.]|jgi:nicotinamide-nucleotide amidase|nr:competence/damage-inducible protein A [Tannerella sp.]
MTVEIITIGDELLIGQVVDTNSVWMAKILNDNGFQVARKMTVGDDADDIKKATGEACGRVPVVLVTGGLGPTKDDITLKALCEYFDTSLYFSEEVYAHIERMFRERGYTMNELTRNQAMVPEKATVIRNGVGTAPCTWFEWSGGVLVSMPGVPYEMKWLMENEIVPRLKKKFHRDVYIRHRTCRVTGIPEAALALRLTDFENNLPSFVKLAYLPQSGIIRLRLSAYSDDEKKAEDTTALLRKQLEEILKEHIIAGEDEETEVIAGEKLRSKGLTVGTAESCTGGAVAALLTSVPGSSDYFRGGVVSYANKVKRNVLGVSAADLEQYGAVSRPVVEQMAKGALQVLGCDYAVATSGVAGPGGGTPEKPVGTVWIAVAGKGRVVSKMYRFTTVREQNIRRTVNVSLLMLLDFISSVHDGGE